MFFVSTFFNDKTGEVAWECRIWSKKCSAASRVD